MEELRKIARLHYEASAPKVQKLAKDFFKQLDADGDGSLDFMEVMTLYYVRNDKRALHPRDFLLLRLLLASRLDSPSLYAPLAIPLPPSTPTMPKRTSSTTTPCYAPNPQPNQSNAQPSSPRGNTRAPTKSKVEPSSPRGDTRAPRKSKSEIAYKALEFGINLIKIAADDDNRCTIS